jgi:beta-carotene 3-hydroxylase
MNSILINISIVLTAFAGMEVVAWLTHKYVMHGLLWRMHSDHHRKESDSFLERNDFFFLIFALPGIACTALPISWYTTSLSISASGSSAVRNRGT